jgi:MATE family multidrug resistance protein
MRPWHGPVWRLALPIMLANVTTPLMGMVDSAIVGHLPDPTLIGAVAVGALVFSFLFWAFGFLRMGTTGFAAQAHGRGDRAEVAACFVRPALLALLLGGLIVALQAPLADLAFGLVGPDAAVERNARIYYEIRVLSAPATLLAYVIVGWFIALQDTRWVLAYGLLTNLLNLGFSLAFVLGLNWGIAGVAWGTVCAEVAAPLLLAPAIAWKLRRHGSWPGLARLLDGRRLLALVRVNADLFLRTLALLLAFGLFTTLGARQGAEVLAANALLLHLQSLLAYALDAFAHAAETLTGAAWGRRDRRALVGALEAATLWAAIFAIGAAIAYALAGPAILRLFTAHQPILELAALYLPWMVVSPLVSVWSFMLDGVFIGATRSATMRNAMLLSLLVYLGAAWALLPVAGNHGLWIAFLLFMLARAITLGAALPALLRRL